MKQAVRNNDTIVILGETGSGKTTRKFDMHVRLIGELTIILVVQSFVLEVPQFLHEAGFSKDGVIGITQPRKVAATSLAARVAAEQGAALGQLIGYSVRFDDKSGPETRIKYLTDGMLVRELLSDPLLSKYSVLVIDEAHERTLRTDLLLSSLKSIQKERNGPGSGDSEDRKGKRPQRKQLPLKVIIMSATLDAERFSKFFNKCVIGALSPYYLRIRFHLY